MGRKLTNFTLGSDNCKIDKELAIRVYKSQLNDEIVPEIIAHKDGLGGERIWGEEKLLDTVKRLTNP